MSDPNATTPPVKSYADLFATAAQNEVSRYFTLDADALPITPKDALESFVADTMSGAPNGEIAVQYDEFDTSLDIKSLITDQFNKLSNLPYVDGAHIDADRERFVLDLSTDGVVNNKLSSIFNDRVSTSAFVGLDKVDVGKLSFAELDTKSGVVAGFSLKVGL